MSLKHLQVDRAMARMAPYGMESDQPRQSSGFAAATQFRALQQQSSKALSAGLPVRAKVDGEVLREAGLNRANWKSHGPDNIGGRTRSILIHPTKTNLMWAATAGGGIWRSENAGDSWEPVDEFFSTLAVSCLAMSPTNNNVMYAGTGEGIGGFTGDPASPSYAEKCGSVGAGIFKSTDEGQNWSLLKSTSAEAFAFVNRVGVSADGSILVAATNDGIYRSNDAGESWSQVLDVPIMDVDFHPSDAALGIAGTFNAGNVYFTNDGGASWNKSSLPSEIGKHADRVELTYALQDPNVVYASISDFDEETGTPLSVLCRSDDGGQTFQVRNNSSGYLGSQGSYDNVVWAGDPTNADFVVVGGLDIWKSSDGGKNLTRISAWHNPDSVHADHHAIVSHPKFDGVANRKVFFGNDGGIYKTDNIYLAGTDEYRARGWNNMNRGLTVTQFYGAAVDPKTHVIIAGAQDNGTLRCEMSQGKSWQEVNGGDGGWCAVDSQDSNYFYGEYIYLAIYRSHDKGLRFPRAKSEIHGEYWNPIIGSWAWKPVPHQIPDARLGKCNFIAPFVLDPQNPNRMYAGGLSLWRSDDVRSPNTKIRGPSWFEVKPPTGDDPRRYSICRIAVNPKDSDNVWIGHNDGAIFRSLNATSASPTWQRTTGSSGELPNRWCGAIYVDAKDPQHVFVAYIGRARDNLWMTTDGGDSWANLGRGLPEAGIRAVTQHPRVPDYVYIGTDVGVFASEDGGQTWSPTAEGPANCSVEQLLWMDETLLAVTYGRGVFSIDLSDVQAPNRALQ